MTGRIFLRAVLGKEKLMKKENFLKISDVRTSFSVIVDESALQYMKRGVNLETIWKINKL